MLLRHERAAGSARILEALLEHRSGSGPETVRAAADRVLRQHAPWALELTKPAIALIEAAGSERDQRLFVTWTLNPDGRTFDDLAKQEGICRQNVNGVVRRAESRVREALGTSPAPLPWAVSTLRARLGTAATQGQLVAELSRLGAGIPPVAELLTWLAGPYLPVPNQPGWVAAQPKPLQARTVACLAADGGVRRLVDVETELVDLGVRTDHIGPWLGASGAVVVHDVVVSMNGPLVDVVERILDAHGSARTAEQIAADLTGGGRDEEPAALATSLRARRFSRTSKGAVGLEAWVEKGRRDAHREAVPRRRETDKASTPAGRPARADQVNRADGADGSDPGDRAGQEQLWLWVRVDPSVLRGSEAAVPVALVEGLGLAPLTRRTFSSRWGPVTLAYDTLQPTRGPVRAVALAAGARVDDTLLLGFRPAGDLDVEVRRGAGRAGGPDEPATKAVIFLETVNGGAP